MRGERLHGKRITVVGKQGKYIPITDHRLLLVFPHHVHIVSFSSQEAEEGVQGVFEALGGYGGGHLEKAAVGDGGGV